MNQEPIFLEIPSNQTVSIGQEMTMRCSAKGYPTPNITWLFNNMDASEMEGVKVSASGELTIARILAAHGEQPFYCVAENVHRRKEASAQLNVVSKTTILLGPVDSTAQVNSISIY